MFGSFKAEGVNVLGWDDFGGGEGLILNLNKSAPCAAGDQCSRHIRREGRCVWVRLRCRQTGHIPRI